MIAEFKLKAPEILRHDGQWYISDLADFQGIKLARLQGLIDREPSEP